MCDCWTRYRKYGKGGKVYASKIGKCPLSRVYEWEKQYDKLKSKKPNVKKLPRGGRKSNSLKYEKNILLWVIENRKLVISSSIKSIIAYLYYNYKETKNEKFINLYMDIIR